MKIKTKLLLGLSILLILAIFLIGIGWFQLWSLNNMTGNLTNSYDIMSQSSKIQVKVKDQAISVRTILAFSDENLVHDQLEYIQSEKDRIIQDIDLLESIAVTSEQKLLIEELKNTNGIFNAYLDDFVNLILAGDRLNAEKLVIENGNKLQDAYFQVTAKISTIFDHNMNLSLTSMKNDIQNQTLTSTIFTLVCMLLGIAIISKNVWNIALRLNTMSSIMSDVANGKADLKTRIKTESKDEIDEVASSFNVMSKSLEEKIEKEQKLSKENQEQAWTNSNIAEIITELSGMHEVDMITSTFLSKVVPLVGASQAAFYLKSKDDDKDELVFKLQASYAFKERKHFTNRFHFGEGLIGQAALEKTPILLTEVPSDYIQIQSALGKGTPLTLYVLPVIFKNDVMAVVEVASFVQFTSVQKDLLDELISHLAIVLDSTLGRVQLAKLLQESQVLMEELQTQSEELQAQQDELKATNEELEAQTQALKNSEEKLQYQQEELEQTNNDLREKAKSLEIQNQKFEATNKEVERAKADLEEKAKQLVLSSKYKSEFLANMSHELRTPLNSLLILSKLLSDNPEGNLTEKQVEFSKTIYSSSSDLLLIINDILDLAKIESGKKDVIVNKVYLESIAEFIENTFKQTALQKGLEFNVQLLKGIPHYFNSDEQKVQQVLKNLLSNAFKFTDVGSVKLEIGVKFDETTNRPILSFSVIDTGIGIAKDKQELIFQAFQQADGTTSRKYGGTGLGLSICREMAALLGGEIVVQSEEGTGSIFTFHVGDYKESETVNESLIEQFQPEAAATMEVIQNPIINDGTSVLQNQSSKKTVKRLLIVDDDRNQRNSLMELIGAKNVILRAVSSGSEALEEIKFNDFDCMLLDLGLVDTSGFELLEKIKSDNKNESLDIIIYTGRDLTLKEEIFLNKYAHTIIIKDSHSPERLMAELELYFHTGSDTLRLNNELIQSHTQNDLAGKKILLVDDDVRNVFALSNVLEMNGMDVSYAVNGIECLKVLEDVTDFDLILMDIMMPEMDGYETMQKLRLDPKYTTLPIIALTAKAMKEDREKCMDAGASDYIVKPVIIDQLLSLLRVWLHPDDIKG